jgi:hypothetical protein
VANGTLANLRVVNAARSPKAILYIYLKFGTDVPWSKIQVFDKALRAFVQSRPREWLGVLGFLTTRVDSSLGFHEMGTTTSAIVRIVVNSISTHIISFISSYLQF